MKNNVIAHIALIIVNALYAASYTVAKFIMPEFILPFGFIFIRVIGALAFFWLIALFFKAEKINKEDYPRLFFCGFFGVALNQLLFFKGLNITTPVNASLMMVTTPILVVVIAIIAKKETFSWYKVLGIMLGALGALIILIGKNFNFNSNTALGDFLVLLNATSYGIFLTIVKPLMKKYSSITVIKWVFLFGFIPVFFVGFTEFNQVNWHSFQLSTWYSLIFIVVGVTCIAYLFNIFALSKVNPSVVGIYIYLQPLLAATIAIMFKADSFNLTKIIAAICVFLGVYFVSFYQPKIKKL